MLAGAIVFLVGLAGAECVPQLVWALQAPPVKQKSQVFDDFTQRVKDYLKLHKTVESSLPRLKTTKHGKTIIDRQHALAQKIAEARSNAKQGLAQMGTCGVCRYSQRCICGEGQQNMKQPVLKLRRVYGLYSHTPSHDDLVHHSNEAQYSPKNRGAGESMPRSAGDC